MIGIIWIICGIFIVIYAALIKKNPAKALNSKARKRKSNLSDEEYVASIYKTTLIVGIVAIILGVLWLQLK